MASKQALILIHGIGEQKPMETLRKFVDAVWTRNTDIHNQFAGINAWSKPDTVSKSFELRRLTTPQNRAGIRTDFFEFYWAHLMGGTTLGHVFGWARSLLLRKPSTVPSHLKLVYWLLIITAIVGVAFAFYTAYAYAAGKQPFGPPWASALIGVVLMPAYGFILRSIVGDAARYLHVAPTNVQSRHEIRQAGIELLKRLHERDYDRIIVVGHSLGSVIGYDILTHAWAEFNNEAPTSDEAATVALDELEDLAKTMEINNVSRSDEQVQAAQRKYFNELGKNGNRWRVTDFVTLGAPLSHAVVLMARDASDLMRKQTDRELPTCLPALEGKIRGGPDERYFSFSLDKKGSYRVPHHAAVFAPTRWTNLYFPSRLIIWGDIVGGPLQKVFGRGIRDVAVSTNQRWGLFSHTLYWIYPGTQDAPAHIEELREALDLADDRPA